MGALHDGHLSLIDLARRRSDDVVVSIFVNPLQFERRDDFDRYPRPIDDDVASLRRRRRRRGVRPDGRDDVPRRVSDPHRTRIARRRHGRGDAARSLPRRDDGGGQAVRGGVASRRGVRREGFPAARRHPADGRRSRHGRRDSSPRRSCGNPTGSPCRAATVASRPRTGRQPCASRARSTPRRRRSPPVSVTSPRSRPRPGRSSRPSRGRVLEYVTVFDPDTLRPLEVARRPGPHRRRGLVRRHPPHRQPRACSTRGFAVIEGFRGGRPRMMKPSDGAKPSDEAGASGSGRRPSPRR